MNKGQIKTLKNELENIRTLKIEKEDIYTYLDDSQISKKSKVKNLECSIMFVDMRHSTDMTDEVGRLNMVKIYKMFTRLVVRAVEENDGHVAQIMGDGMLCIFTGDNINSGQKAVDAAISINTYLETAYNPIVDNNWKIECGIGIRTGHVYITRVGIKGKNRCSKVVYPSSITNYACKLCNLAEGGEILFDNTTYSQINKICKDRATTAKNKYLKNCKSIKNTVWEIGE